MRRHLLPIHLLRTVTSGMAGEELMPVLVDAEYSLRLVALRAVLDTVRQAALETPLADVDVAWDLLVRVDGAAPEVVRRVLAYPYVGTWARSLLRRLRGAAPAATSVPVPPGGTVPLWVEVGYLHALAASAAARAGLAFRIRVPAVHGAVSLPTLGLVSPSGDPDSTEVANPAVSAATAQVTGLHGRVEVDIDGAVVRLPAALVDEGRSWRPVRRVRVTEGGAALAVTVDDLDPYRAPGGRSAAQPLGAAESARWRELLAQAWRLLVAVDGEAARTMGRVLGAITPLAHAERFSPRSASSADAFGSLLASTPDDAAQLAAVLVHEFQHSKLGAVMHLARLYEAGPDRLLYAPWRNDPRPLSGVLQGIYAFTGVTWFWRAHRHRAATEADRRLAEFEFALWRVQTTRTVASVRGNPDLTALGEWFVGRVGRWLAPWELEPVPWAIERAAGLAAAEHRTGWRLHHLRPAAEVVERLAAAWQAGTAARLPAAHRPVVEPAPDPARLETRAVLLRYRLADPAAFARFVAEPHRAVEAVQGADAADVLLAAGRFDDARTIHAARARRAPAGRDAWVGLTLCLCGQDPAPGTVDAAARSALLRHAEVVRAVACRVADTGRPAPDPVRLAAWLAGQLDRAAPAPATPR
ncbi:HEXXH motif domain-containing protein [Frankia sp. QA3]|uniref:HEXXH motif domain-containing protein n=1 Tax=Frankia sp. QA3 TaxID=710111 RepID=UPI0012F8540E|nr:HEXXH motif domain-containing protein [Frankia sp. QA3]